MGEREKDGRGEKDLRYFCFSLKPVILARERISREPVKIFHLLSLFSSFLIEKSALKIGAPRGFLPVSFNFLVLFYIWPERSRQGFGWKFDASSIRGGGRESIERENEIVVTIEVRARRLFYEVPIQTWKHIHTHENITPGVRVSFLCPLVLLFLIIILISMIDRRAFTQNHKHTTHTYILYITQKVERCSRRRSVLRLVRVRSCELEPPPRVTKRK